MRTDRRNQSGQSMVLIALAMTAIVGLLALVVDGGYGYLQRRRMQNAADAGAFAGARALGLRTNNSAASEATIVRAINTYAEQNGTPDTNGVAGDQYNGNVTAYFLDRSDRIVGSQIGLNGSVPSSAVSVRVQPRVTFNTFLAGAIGSTTATATAVSEAGYGAVTGMSGLAPIAVHWFDFVVGNPYTIWDDDKTEANPLLGVIVGGQRGWLNFNGGSLSNSELQEWMTRGYNGRVDVGDWINGDPGTRGSTVQDAGARVGEVIYIPVYDTVRSGTSGSGSLDYHIVAFAAFRISSVDASGSEKKINGTFVRWAVAGDWGNGIDAGVITVKMTGPTAPPPPRATPTAAPSPTATPTRPPQTPTPTAVSGATVTPTPTGPTATPTRTPVATATPTITPTPTPTPMTLVVQFVAGYPYRESGTGQRVIYGRVRVTSLGGPVSGVMVTFTRTGVDYRATTDANGYACTTMDKSADFAQAVSVVATKSGYRQGTTSGTVANGGSGGCP